MVGFGQIGRIRQVFQVHQVLVQPLLVGIGPGDLVLDLLVGHDPALLGVHQEHAPRLQPALLQHPLGGHFQHPHFRSHDDQVVLGHIVARRPQPIAVEHGADADAVGKGNRGRPIPRFHQATVELVEGLPLRAHALVVGPRLGDHHHDRLRQGASRQHQQLQAVVEHSRVAAVLADDRQQLLEVLAEQLGLEQGLAGPHPVHVAPEGVDLAVVRQIPVGMGARPARESVGAEAGMDQRQGALHGRVGQIRIILLDLLGHEHALIDQRLAGQAADVKILAGFIAGVADGVLGPAPNHIQLALEVHRGLHAGPPADDHLPHKRLSGPGGVTQVAVVGGHGAPAEQLQPLLLHDLPQATLAFPGVGLLDREKYIAHAIAALGRQRNAGIPAGLLHEAVGHLDEDSGAIAGVVFAPAGAPVTQIHQYLQSLVDDIMRAAPFDVGHEAHSAGFMLELRIIKPLRRGQPPKRRTFGRFLLLQSAHLRT